MNEETVNILIMRHNTKGEIRVDMITFITKLIQHNVLKNIVLTVSLCAFFPTR